MIAHLRGSLFEKRDDGTVVVEAGGVGYLVTVPFGVLRTLPASGEVRLWIHSHAAKDGPLQLFGFLDGGERELFDTMLSVQGVGPKVAIAVLSGLPAPELRKVLVAGDVARLTQVRGVGRKTAERLVMELREKVGPAAEARRESGNSLGIPSGKLGDVYGALMSLGYKISEFESLVAKMDPGEATADLIRKALSALRRK